MKQALLLLLLCLVVAGCTVRTALYAPRRSGTPEHRGATVNQDCLGCHDLAGLRHHAAEDNCLRCHPICREC